MTNQSVPLAGERFPSCLESDQDQVISKNARMTSLVPRSTVSLLKGVSRVVQGGNRGVATVMADLPEEHVSWI